MIVYITGLKPYLVVSIVCIVPWRSVVSGTSYLWLRFQGSQHRYK